MKMSRKQKSLTFRDLFNKVAMLIETRKIGTFPRYNYQIGYPRYSIRVNPYARPSIDILIQDYPDTEERIYVRLSFITRNLVCLISYSNYGYETSRIPMSFVETISKGEYMKSFDKYHRYKLRDILFEIIDGTMFCLSDSKEKP